MALDRASAGTPLAPSEAVRVEEFGDEVIVQALSLRGHLEYAKVARSDPDGAMSRLLSQTVLASDLKPLYTVEQWEAWGARHPLAALTLYQHAQRISGLTGEAAEKN